MNPEDSDLFYQGSMHSEILIKYPTFQYMSSQQNVREYQSQNMLHDFLRDEQRNSRENSIVIEPSPINDGHYFNQSPVHELFDDEEDISLINHIQEPSQYSQQVQEMSQLSLLQPKTKQDLTDQPKYKKKKVGCSCMKRKCSSKYCFCIKDGQSCSPLCKCTDCNNNKSSLSLIKATSNIQEVKGCKCKKNNCLKGYCDCFAKGAKCSSKCKCCDCKNIILPLENIKDQFSIPSIKKKIKKFSKFYRNKKGYIRTNRRKILGSLDIRKK